MPDPTSHITRKESAQRQRDYKKVRALYESTNGISWHELERQVDGRITRKAIQIRAEVEGWVPFLKVRIKNATTAAMADVTPGMSPGKIDDKVQEHADQRAGVLRRHQAAWQAIESLRLRALEMMNHYDELYQELVPVIKEVAETCGDDDDDDEPRTKAARLFHTMSKILTHAERISRMAEIQARGANMLQSGERRSWGMDDDVSLVDEADAIYDALEERKQLHGKMMLRLVKGGKPE